MKKLTTIVTALILLLSATAFATTGDNVTKIVKGAFEKDFTRAQNVTWQKTGDFYFANFVMNGLETDAAYNEAGELVGTSRKITVAQLPLNVSLALSQQYKNYTLKEEATELSFDGETQYYVTVDNAKQTLRLKCRTSGDISVEKKLKH